MLKALQRDRWLAWMLLAATGILLVLVVRDFGVGLPEFPRSPRRAPSSALTVPVSEFDGLFSAVRVPRLLTPTNAFGPFYTAYFQPPPPKPPTTRKVDLTYLGYIETDAGPRRAFVQVGETLFVGPAGSNVVADLAVAAIDLRTLVLTNRAAQTNQLEFNVRKPVEVPLP
jgi:hypothetical protein